MKQIVRKANSFTLESRIENLIGEGWIIHQVIQVNTTKNDFLIIARKD